jgi:hypothetical protein
VFKRKTNIQRRSVITTSFNRENDLAVRHPASHSLVLFWATPDRVGRLEPTEFNKGFRFCSAHFTHTGGPISKVTF